MKSLFNQFPAFSKWEVLWWGMISCHLLVVWVLPHFFTQDGSAHLYTASVFLQLLGSDAPLVREVYQFNHWYVPTWAGGAFFALLVKIFGFIAAEKLLVSIIMVFMAVGFKRLLNAWRISHVVAPFLILPFLFNHILMLGLYYFLLSLGLSLLLFAWGYEQLQKLDYKKSGLLAVAFLLTFYVHPIPPTLAGMGLVLFTLCGGSYKSKSETVVSIKRLLWLGAAALPSAWVGLNYVLRSTYEGAIASGRGLVPVLEEIVSVSVLVSFQTSPHWWNVLFAAVLLVVTLRVLLVLFKKRNFVVMDLMLLVTVALIAVMAVIPEGVTGGSLMSIRLNLIFWMVWAVWIASRLGTPEIQWLRHSILIVLCLAPLLQVREVYVNQKAVQPFLRQLEQAVEAIPEHSRVWPVVMNPQGEWGDQEMWAPRNRWLTHCGLRFLAVKQDVAAMIAYQGEVGHFMTCFRDSEGPRYFREDYDMHPADFIRSNPLQGWWLLVGVDQNQPETEPPLVSRHRSIFGNIDLFKQ